MNRPDILAISCPHYTARCQQFHHPCVWLKEEEEEEEEEEGGGGFLLHY